MSTLTALDVDTFLKELEEYDSAKCTSSHLSHSNGRPYRNSECSVDAVARLTYACGASPVLWCQSRYDSHLKTPADNVCHKCKRLLTECWTVLPI